MPKTKLTDLLNNIENIQLVSDFLKKLALENVPMDRNVDLKLAFERQDIQLFHDLLVDYVPDLQTRIVSYLESLSLVGDSHA